jgi:hypothetical protein
MANYFVFYLRLHIKQTFSFLKSSFHNAFSLLGSDAKFTLLCRGYELLRSIFAADLFVTEKVTFYLHGNNMNIWVTYESISRWQHALCSSQEVPVILSGLQRSTLSTIFIRQSRINFLNSWREYLEENLYKLWNSKIISISRLVLHRSILPVTYISLSLTSFHNSCVLSYAEVTKYVPVLRSALQCSNKPIFCFMPFLENFWS